MVLSHAQRRVIKRKYKQRMLRQTTPKKPADFDCTRFGSSETHDFLIRKLHTSEARSYTRYRDLRWYNNELRDWGLPSLDEIIVKIPKQKIRLLDVGAGHGVLGNSIRIHYPNTKTAKKKVEYHGIDLKRAKMFNEHDKPIGEVEQHDVVTQPLPRNYFDLIVGVYSFPYMTDKFRALENCIDALRVDGVLVINSFGKFTLGDIGFGNNTQFTTQSILSTIIKLNNPHLEVEITPQDGILIKKKENKLTKIQAKFVRSTYYETKSAKEALEKGSVSSETFLTSHYVIPKIKA